jgi:hypothetical protein
VPRRRCLFKLFGERPSLGHLESDSSVTFGLGPEVTKSAIRPYEHDELSSERSPGADSRM